MKNDQNKIKSLCVDPENNEKLIYDLILEKEEIPKSNYFYSIKESFQIDKKYDKNIRNKFMKKLISLFQKTTIDLNSEGSLYKEFNDFINK